MVSVCQRPLMASDLRLLTDRQGHRPPSPCPAASVSPSPAMPFSLPLAFSFSRTFDTVCRRRASDEGAILLRVTSGGFSPSFPPFPLPNYHILFPSHPLPSPVLPLPLPLFSCSPFCPTLSLLSSFSSRSVTSEIWMEGLPFAVSCSVGLGVVRPS